MFFNFNALLVADPKAENQIITFYDAFLTFMHYTTGFIQLISFYMIGGLAASKLCQTFYISMYQCLSMYDFRNINGI